VILSCDDKQRRLNKVYAWWWWRRW